MAPLILALITIRGLTFMPYVLIAFIDKLYF
jgi:hypothetical protein